MKNRKSAPFYIFIAVIFCVIYIICAVRPLGTEYQFIPDWKIDISNPSVRTAENGEDLLYFKLGQTMGYFTADGKVTNFITYPFKSSISPVYYTAYNANSSSVPFFTPDGTKAGTITEYGFPMIDEDRIFVFLPGGSSFVMCNNDGSSKWKYSGTVPITAFDSSAAGCTAGFADGTVCEFDFDGNIIQRFAPGGSDYPVILGAAISPSGEYIATVSGQNRQRFVLAKKYGTQTKIIFHEFIDSGEPRQELVKFSSNSGTVFYNSKGRLGIVNTKTCRSAHIELKGHVISIQESGDCVFVLAKDGTVYTVYAVEKFATLTGSFSFSAGTAFIETKDGQLYVGKDSTISRISISKN